MTARHVPAAFLGSNANGPAPPANPKSWEFVTAPPEIVRLERWTGEDDIPPSARPPQENMMTVLPAARRGSKFAHA